MIIEIIDLLQKGKLDEASKFFIDDINFPPGTLNWIHNSHNIALYTTLVKMLINKETIQGHERASFLLAMYLLVWEGAFSVALFHARKALSLEPHNLDHKIFLIFFHDIPENLIKKDEAIKIAQEVLTEDPDCGVAINVLKRYGIIKES